MGVVNILAIILGLLFVWAGTVKVVPINPFGHGYDVMSEEFVRYATVSPLKAIGLDLSPDLYRTSSVSSNLWLGVC
ncbi:hypothetical protein BSL78_23878 [Apostichopus japonicus]|uniref:Uncharacterized protein n=1 Tax=Stichopus japonicus TaxID=307972 RepID=A0A2G8JUB1_STIJA|nr:hypothetical protein BSL78_23878 [Apostichopus japonicus]